MSNRSSAFRLVDLVLKGHLADHLQTWQAEGRSLEDIAYELRSKHDVRLSRETIRRWLRDEASAA